MEYAAFYFYVFINSKLLTAYPAALSLIRINRIDRVLALRSLVFKEKGIPLRITRGIIVKNEKK